MMTCPHLNVPDCTIEFMFELIHFCSPSQMSLRQRSLCSEVTSQEEDEQVEDGRSVFTEEEDAAVAGSVSSHEGPNLPPSPHQRVIDQAELIHDLTCQVVDMNEWRNHSIMEAVEKDRCA